MGNTLSEKSKAGAGAVTYQNQGNKGRSMPAVPVLQPKSKNKTGLPDNLKTGIENLSGFSMDDTRVHYNSSQPAQLNALAYAQGSDIHVGPGQEKHLPHEAWHVVQQKQGRVKPTLQMKEGVPVNDDAGLEHEADVMGAKAVQMKQTIQHGLKNASTAGVVQKNDDEGRAADPFERGAKESPQVHHIISHSKLVGGLGKLEGGDQAEVKSSFMPSLDKLTIRQIYNLSSSKGTKFVNTAITDISNQTLSKDKEFFDDMQWTEAGLNTLNAGKVTITDANMELNHTLAEWKAAYLKVKNGEAAGIGKAEFWKNLQDSFFEWSGGNLFYGATKRAEPGGADLDKFDEDAQYFRDPAHVAKLKKLAAELEGAKDDKAKIKEKLLAIGELNKDEGAGPMHDPSKWIKPKTADQKSIILDILPDGPRKTFISSQVEYKALPIELVQPLLKSKIGNLLQTDIGSKTTREALFGICKKASNAQSQWRGSIAERTEGLTLFTGGLYQVTASPKDGAVGLVKDDANGEANIAGLYSLDTCKGPVINGIVSLLLKMMKL